MNPSTKLPQIAVVTQAQPPQAHAVSGTCPVCAEHCDDVLGHLRKDHDLSHLSEAQKQEIWNLIGQASVRHAALEGVSVVDSNSGL